MSLALNNTWSCLSLKVENAEGLLPERVWQESILCSAKVNASDQASGASSGGANTTVCGPGTPASSNTDNVGQWDFVDPLKKSVCTCSK